MMLEMICGFPCEESVPSLSRIMLGCMPKGAMISLQERNNTTKLLTEIVLVWNTYQFEKYAVPFDCWNFKSDHSRMLSIKAGAIWVGLSGEEDQGFWPRPVSSQRNFFGIIQSVGNRLIVCRKNSFKHFLQE